MSTAGATAPTLGIRPDRVGVRRIRVWCVVPWHTGAGDAEAVLRDVAAQQLRMDGGESADVIDLRVLLVGNAPTESARCPDNRAGVTFEQLNLRENRGGSGGFNAGLEWALREAGAGASDDDAYVWLLDSDARASTSALYELVRTLDAHPRVCAAGSALADPETGRVFEVGGMVDRRDGSLRPACGGVAGAGGIVPCDYVASCSALVRLSAARAAGPMPDFFLHADDVVWMLRMSRVTGLGVAGVTSSVVYHPRFDRYALRGRYYAARNGLEPLRELGLGRLAVFRRALREAARGAQQELCGRRDLARLHLMGLRDAIEGVTGAGAGLAERIEGFAPLEELGTVLKPLVGSVGCRRVRVAGEGELGLREEEYERLVRALGEAGLHPSGDRRGVWRVVPAGAPGRGLLDAPGLVMIAPGVRGGSRRAGFVVRTGTGVGAAWNAGRVGAAGGWLALRAALAPSRRALVARAPSGVPGASSSALTLSIVVVSHNRWNALRDTLARLSSMQHTRGSEVIVVDNASSDGSAGLVEREFPRVRLLRLGVNAGVAAFNRGVEAATGDVVLVLDDDAWPDSGAVARAMEMLARDPRLGAVTLHPRHPSTGRSEWRHSVHAEGGRDDWPVMGCGNLVRCDAWRGAGGYEEGYFLYRNDVDLALKLLGAGWGVHFNPAWTVWHDSPAAARKSTRWHRLATRNWIWLARRHGTGLGLDGALGALVGWGWAHRLAGTSPARQWATLRGAIEGLARRHPSGGAQAGRSFGRLVRLAMGRGDR